MEVGRYRSYVIESQGKAGHSEVRKGKEKFFSIILKDSMIPLKP